MVCVHPPFVLLHHSKLISWNRLSQIIKKNNNFNVLVWHFSSSFKTEKTVMTMWRGWQYDGVCSDGLAMWRMTLLRGGFVVWWLCYIFAWLCDGFVRWWLCYVVRLLRVAKWVTYFLRVILPQDDWQYQGQQRPGEHQDERQQWWAANLFHFTI